VDFVNKHRPLELAQKPYFLYTLLGAGIVIVLSYMQASYLKTFIIENKL